MNGWKRELCDCRETRINGVRYALHRPIDHEYARERSKLVDEAGRRASKKVRGLPADASDAEREDYATAYTRTFAKIMDKLSAPLLKQSTNGSASNGGASPPSSEAQSDLSKPHGNANSPDDSVTQAVIACWNG